MKDKNKEKFIEEIESSFKNNIFVKLVMSKPIFKNDDLKKVFIRLVKIKKGQKLSFVYKYKTKDITKNYSIAEGIDKIKSLLEEKFLNFVLFTINNDIQLIFNKRMEAKMACNKPTYPTSISTEHDIEKTRMIPIKDNKYLRKLGIATEDGRIIKGMQNKFRQINKYIEIIDSIIKSSDLIGRKKLNIVDMGSGKGYLTFALYDYLTNNLKIDTHISGVEMREDLINLSNDIAKDSNFKNLKFYKSNIKDYQIKDIDILVALHACDTATDDAIYKGIFSNASIIITAPCCHKQIRRELKVENELKYIIKYGILKERLAEIITDTLRGLILESQGYKTQIFEFISTEHTYKNIMIVGIKDKKLKNKNVFFEKIKKLKKIFGIEYFYLENLF